MATLEKIRSKSGVLLVVIGLALLAFILGDFFNSGRSLFGLGTTIAKVDGQKIDVQEFQRRVEQANQQMQQSGQKVDQAVLQQQVLNAMITEALFKNEAEKLGLIVTDAELSQLMLGDNSMVVDNMVRQQLGVESAAIAHDMAFNPQKYQLSEEQAAQLKQYWIDLEKQIEEQLIQAKFQNLFAGLLVANDLDAKALYNDNSVTSNIAYAKKDYSSLPDDKFVPTDDEIKAEWERTRNRYRLDEETRSVNYISVEIAPSQADLLAGQKAVEDVIAALREKPGTEGADGVSGFIVDRQNYTSSLLRDPQLKKFVDSAAVNQVALINSAAGDYTIAKLLDKKTQVDSVNIDFLAVQGSKAQIDSLCAVLNGGGALADALKSPIVAQSQDSTWLSLVDPNFAGVRDILDNAATGTFFSPDSIDGEGGRIFRVRARRPAVNVYDVATVSYNVEPSSATVNKLMDDLQTYLDNNKSAADFAANAAKSNYNAIPARVSASTPQLGNISDTRDAVAWAMNAKKGQVSPIFGDETSDRLIAVALDNVYNDFIPDTDPQVRMLLTSTVRNDKKAEALINQYKGKAKDVAGYASLMGSKVDSTSVTFGQFFIPGIGGQEGEFTAYVATAKPGTCVGPVKSNSGVIVFTVTGTEKNPRPYNFDESAAQYNQQRGGNALLRNLAGILIGKSKVTNNILKFFSRSN